MFFLYIFFPDRQAEEFLNTFESTYILLEQRIGEASNVVGGGSGGVVRLLKCFPEDWHVSIKLRHCKY